MRVLPPSYNERMFAVEQLLESARNFAGADVRLESDSDLLDAAVRLAAARSFVEATEAHVLAELDTRGVTDRDHGMKTVPWVARESGCARGPIRGRLTTGRALRNRVGHLEGDLINTIPRRSLNWGTAHDAYHAAVAMTG